MRYIIPAAVAALYITQGIYHAWKQEWGFSVMWLAYGIANVGLMMAMSTGKDH